MKLTVTQLRQIIKGELSEAITAGPGGRQLEQGIPTAAFTSVKAKPEELLLAKLAEDTSTHGSEADWYSVIEDRLGDNVVLRSDEYEIDIPVTDFKTFAAKL